MRSGPRLMIYGIGGDFAEQLVGCAHDVTTARSLIRLLRLSGANGCSVHGSLGYGTEPLSGELGLGAFERLLDQHDPALAVC